MSGTAYSGDPRAPAPQAPGHGDPGLPAVGGEIAGRYALVRLIGKGGMGAVYEARHRETQKRCALKLLLSPDLMRNREMLARFQREARACAAIESEHIVQVFDSGTDAQTGLPYMVMEYLVGEDLDQVSERLGPLRPDVAARLILQACIGLGKAHDAGIVHRDIKLANLFLTHRDSAGLTVKVLDFGIAKVKMENFAQTAGAEAHKLTRTGSMLGTPLYMSPEQAKGAAHVDAQTDVWSMGIALYRLLAGRTPFESAESLGELMVGIITGQVPPVQDLAPWVPPGLAGVVETALSRDLSVRYRNANQLREALSEQCPQGGFVGADALVSLPAETRATIAPRLPRQPGMQETGSRIGLAMTAGSTQTGKLSRGGRWAIGAGLGVLLLGGATGAVVVARTRQPPVIATVGPAPDASESARGLASPAGESSTPALRTSRLRVSPDGVQVTVDGTAAEVVDGSVAISGQAGATRAVGLTYKGSHSEQVVAITQDGLVPSAISVESKAASPAVPGSKGDRKAPGDSRTAAPPGGKAPAATADKKPPPRINKDTSEIE